MYSILVVYMPNDTTSQWILTNAKADVTAKSQATKVSYLLGKHEWTIYNNDCNKGKTQTPLKITGNSFFSLIEIMVLYYVASMIMVDT